MAAGRQQQQRRAGGTGGDGGAAGAGGRPYRCRQAGVAVPPVSAARAGLVVMAGRR
ncbi:hypothetical protein [Mycobacterium riyadhense]|uniref:hypothetical protein n=1 Tax=Mycobacterium riyadhense TaxID=486698 RepID=UPI00195E0959|nr:hypothetical protein [Mycobacterium riyadhense]